MQFKVLVPLLPLGMTCLVAACSVASDPSPGVDPSAADGGVPAEATREAASTAPQGDPDGSREPLLDGGIVCQKRCEKAGCADVEACVDRCAKEAATIPASCQPNVSELETCVDANGSWTCDHGEAKATGPCTKEAFALLNCVLGGSSDGGIADAAADGSL